MAAPKAKAKKVTAEEDGRPEEQDQEQDQRRLTVGRAQRRAVLLGRSIPGRKTLLGGVAQ